MSHVSVVIPTHNRAHLLEITLRNVLCSEGVELEVFVVDDGGSDGSDQVVKRFPSVSYDRFDEPRGACAARNEGFRRTTGEFVMFLDSDDLVHPAKLASQVQRLAEQPDLDATVCQMGHFVQNPNESEFLWNTFAGDAPAVRYLRHDPVWGMHAPLWRRSSLGVDAPFDESLPLAQDFHFHVERLLGGAKVELLPELMSFCRKHDGPSIGGIKVSRRAETLLKIYRQIEPKLVSDEQRKAWKGSVLWLASYASAVPDPALLEEALALAHAKSGLFARTCRRAASTGLGRYRKLAFLLAKLGGHDLALRESWHQTCRADIEPNLRRYPVPEHAWRTT